MLDTNNYLLFGIKYSYLIMLIFKQIYLFIDEILTGTIPDQSGSGSNDDEEVPHTSKIFKTIGCCLVSFQGNLFWWGWRLTFI